MVKNNYSSKLLTVSLLIIIAVILYYLVIDARIVYSHINKTNTETFDAIEVPTLPRPFVNLYDDKGNKVNIICVSHPFTRNTGTNGSYEQYEKWVNKGIHFIGISSYAEFPGLVSNPYDSLSNKELDAWKKYDYMALLEAWLHCFRYPDKYITSSSMPTALISESDFTDIKKHKPDPTVPKEYDFIYVCLKDNDKCEPGWQSYLRNWDVAKKCLDIMCNKYKLKGLIIGRVNCNLPKNCHVLDFLPHNKFIQTYKKCKFVFVPNITDASPRVLTEALNYDLPCLVNYNILGGWKYVNEQTGEFFTNETDFEPALKTLLDNFSNYTPSKYYKENYGTVNAGRRLKDFLCENIKDINFTRESTDYISMGT